MISTACTLRDRHRRTLSDVFAHPTAHNLAWADVLALVGQVGTATAEPNGKLCTTVGGRSVSWQPEGSQLSETEVLALRKFLQTVGVTPLAPAARPAPTPEGPQPRRAAVVMTYRDAHVHGDGDGDHPTVVLEPFDPNGRLQHLHEKAGQWRGFYRLPQPEYFARIADAIRGFDEVLLLGHGKGHSNAMLQLQAYLDRQEPEVARRVAGAVDVDVGDLTDAEVEQAMREFFGEASVHPVPHPVG
jgi:hypothetical protein